MDASANHKRTAFNVQNKLSWPGGGELSLRDDRLGAANNRLRMTVRTLSRGNIRMGGTVQKSLLGALALFALMFAPAAWAVGPPRQNIAEAVEIDAPPAKVWAAIADFHDMSWLPGVAKTTGEGGNVRDAAKRRLTLSSGATIDESLYKYGCRGDELFLSHRQCRCEGPTGQQLFRNHHRAACRGGQKQG